MVITYHGAECFKVSLGEITLAFNPISKQSTHKQARFGADIALISLNHPDMNGVESVSHGSAEPFVIDGPGEYEVKKIAVRGLPSTSAYSGDEHINTIYLVSLEGMALCFLGALNAPKLSPAVREELDGIDVLFVPIGGTGVLAPADAHELAVELEPHIVIPMHYPTAQADVGDKNALSQFLKEEGSSVSPVDKLTIKKKDVESKEGEIIVLSA